MSELEGRLRDLRASGRKALVPYFVAGLTEDWLRHVEAAVAGGADAIEVGLPFSDPMIDGVVIQEAASRSLARGTTIESVCQSLAALDAAVPLIAMTYYNVVLHHGLERSAGRLREAGVSGAILPDLSLEELGPWREAAAGVDLATVLLVAPSTPPTRLAQVCLSSQGFVYAAARMAVTGAKSDDGEGARVAQAVREVSDRPVYVGIGIATPAMASAAAATSDGVIVGSALVRRVLDGATAHEVESFVASFRAALDGAK